MKQHQAIGSEAARKEGKMLEVIKETREACNKHGTIFQIFVDEAEV